MLGIACQSIALCMDRKEPLPLVLSVFVLSSAQGDSIPAQSRVMKMLDWASFFFFFTVLITREKRSNSARLDFTVASRMIKATWVMLSFMFLFASELADYSCQVAPVITMLWEILSFSIERRRKPTPPSGNSQYPHFIKHPQKEVHFKCGWTIL